MPRTGRRARVCGGVALFLVAASLRLVTPAGASSAETLPAQRDAAPRLKIVVLEGEGAVNIIQQRTAVSPIVEVRDRNDQPVVGAAVRFTIRRGSATFNGSRALSVATDGVGRAAATGFTPTTAGPLQIGVSASSQGVTATATISQVTVQTAAQAVAASAGAGTGAGGGGATAGGGAATGGGAAAGGVAAGGAAAAGAAGGGGTGLSLATVGIIGAAGAGGAVAATTLTGGSSTPTEGRFAVTVTGVPGTNSETSSTGVTCARPFQQMVYLSIVVTGQQPAVNEMVLTREYTGAGSCTGTVPGWSLNLSLGQLSQSGTPDNFSFRFDSSPSQAGGPQTSISATFSGALADGEFTGSMTISDQIVFASGATRSGTVAVPLNLDFTD